MPGVRGSGFLLAQEHKLFAANKTAIAAIMVTA
jgi:hypothetical protein